MKGGGGGGGGEGMEYVGVFLFFFPKTTIYMDRRDLLIRPKIWLKNMPIEKRTITVFDVLN